MKKTSPNSLKVLLSFETMMHLSHGKLSLLLLRLRRLISKGDRWHISFACILICSEWLEALALIFVRIKYHVAGSTCGRNGKDGAVQRSSRLCSGSHACIILS